MNTVSDIFEPTLEPIVRLKPLYAWADGIFSPLGRISGALRIIGNRPESFYQDHMREEGYKIAQIEALQTEARRPADCITNVADTITSDVTFLKRENYPQIAIPTFGTTGRPEDLWIHPSAKISSAAFLDTQNGPIVIDQDVQVSAFTLIKGPAYIGPKSILDRAGFESARAGISCRLGGEISQSIIGNFTNKHHEGFLGHSIVGDWVNLGALTTTSDLKNNYGEIRLEYKGQTYPTKTIKFGSIIGDYAKTSIGTMLNTGTILGVGALLFEGRPVQKHYPDFFWGGKADMYDFQKFLKDMEKIMARRDQKPTDRVVSLLENPALNR